MNTKILLSVFERMHDRSIASMIAAGGAGTEGAVTERTARNWLEQRTTPDPETLKRLAAGSRQNLRKSLEASERPAEEREAIIEAVDTYPGFISGFAASLQNGGGKYPAFIHLASQIDRLELALETQQAARNLEGWVQTLLEADWVRDEHLINPEVEGGAEATRCLMRRAKSWEDLILPVAIFVTNVQFQLLATLDLEFCAEYLPDWEATPIFASLQPRLHPRTAPFIGTISTRRDLLHYPTRRLLEATACLRALRYSPGREWPRAIPRASQMTAWLDLAGEEKLASNLPKWRSGRTMNAARFDDLWQAWFSFLPEAQRPVTPLPMLYAVMVFTELFVKGSREGRDLTFISPDPAFYQHWWNIQQQKLSTGADALQFGTRKWMPGLN
jgi:hypothetical protein